MKARDQPQNAGEEAPLTRDITVICATFFVSFSLKSKATNATMQHFLERFYLMILFCFGDPSLETKSQVLDLSSKSISKIPEFGYVSKPLCLKVQGLESTV